MFASVSRPVRAVVSCLLVASMVTAMLPAAAAPVHAGVSKDKLKTLEQVRDEASRYDRAVLAIARISTLPLASRSDLAAAVALIDRHGPALKLAGSKLVVMAVDDPVLTATVKRRLKDTRSAEAFARELTGDPKSVLKLEGAADAQARMIRLLASNAAKVQAAGKALAAAAEKQSTGASAKLRPVAEGIGGAVIASLVMSALLAAMVFTPLSLLAAAAVAGAVVGAFLAIIAVESAVLFTELVTRLAGNLTTEEGQDAVEACLGEADAALASCKDAVKDLPEVIRLPVEVACHAQWLLEAGACWIA